MRDGSLRYYSNEEGKKKSVISTLRQSHSGERTSIEKIIFDELKKLGINFTEQVQVGYWVVDFYIPDYNLIIETYGDYWHGNPKVFKDLNSTQRKNQGRDKAKETYSHNHDYNYLTLWEKDINERIDWCVEQINEVIRAAAVS